MILKKISLSLIFSLLVFAMVIGCDPAPKNTTGNETASIDKNKGTEKGPEKGASTEEWQAVTVKVTGMT